MPGPLPKPSATRQRRNRHATRAELPSPAESQAREVPRLPDREGGWHMRVLEWWQSVWRSPMAAEFLDAELRGGLYLLAELHQKRWTAESTTELLEVAKEIRLQEARFGLSPIDRRRLQWEVRGEGVSSTSSASPRKQRPPRRAVKDPRAVLKAV